MEKEMNDEGKLQIALYVEDGVLVMDFGKEISWLGLDKQSCIALIARLRTKVREL